jgi:heptosyltransferase-2
MKIAVLCLPGIGDALMATPMISLLRKNYPSARIDIICMFDGVSYIFETNKDISHTFKLSLYKENKIKGLIQIYKLRKQKYDISIMAFPAFRREYNLVHYIVGAKKRIAHSFTHGYFSEFTFLNNTTIPFDGKEHNVINNLNLLNSLQIKWNDTIKRNTISYLLHLQHKDVLFGTHYIASKGLANKKLLAIHPGSINSKAGLLKRWPIKNYINLINTLADRNCHILLFGGPFEKEIITEITKSVKKSSYLTVVDNVTFGQSLGILQKARLLISNDNGFAHLANALQINELTLFGPTNPIWCSPYNKNYAHVIREASFTPWFRPDMKVTTLPRFAPSGMELITVASVLNVLKKLL